MYKFNLTVGNGVTSKSLNKTMKIVEPVPAGSLKLKKNKVTLAGNKWKLDVTSTLTLTGNTESLKLVKMSDGSQPAPIDAKLVSITEDKNLKFEVGDYTTGKLFQVKDNLYLVASYDPTRKNDYGVLRLFSRDETSGEI